MGEKTKTSDDFLDDAPINALAAQFRSVTDRTYPPECTCICGRTANPIPAPPGTRYRCEFCPDEPKVLR